MSGVVLSDLGLIYTTSYIYRLYFEPSLPATMNREIT